MIKLSSSTKTSDSNAQIVYALLFMQLLTVFLQYSFVSRESVFLLKWVGIFDELLSMLALLFLLVFNRSKLSNIPKILFIPIFVIIPYIAFTAFLNDTSVINILMAYRAYFLYFPSMLLAYYYLRQRYTQQLLRWFGIMILFEFGIIIFQAINNFLINRPIILGDAVPGTFSGANNLGYTLGMIFLVYLILYIYRINILSRTWDVSVIILAFISIFLVEAKATLMLFVIIGVFLILSSRNIRFFILTNLHKIALLSLFSVAVFAGVYSSKGSFTNNNIVNVFKLTETLQHEQNIHSGSNRLLWFPLTKEHLDKFAVHPLLGIGPSTHSSQAAVTLESPIAMNYVINAFGQREIGLDGGVDSQIIPIFGEYGYLGLLLFYGMFAYILLYFWRQFKHYVSHEIQGPALAGFALTCYFILMSYANHIWEGQAESFTYWILIVLMLKTIQHDTNATITSERCSKLL